MSLFDNIIRDLTGGNKRNNSYNDYNDYSDYSDYNDYSSGYTDMRPKSMYQCRYCGMRYQTNNPNALPRGGTGCRARGMGNNYKPLDHVWEKIG